MFLLRRRLLLNLLKLSDLCILMTGFLIGAWLTTTLVRYVSWIDFLSIRIKISNLIVVLAMMFLWHLIYRTFGLYQSRRLQSLYCSQRLLPNCIQEWQDIVKATTTGTLVFFLGAKILDIRLFTPFFALMFWLSTTCLTVSFRTILRSGLKQVRAHGRNLRFALIVGTNERAYSFAQMIEEHRESGYRVAGYVDDHVHVPKKGIELLGSHEDFSEVLRSRVIDEVIIALPIKSQYERIQRIIDQAEEQGIRVRCLPHLFNSRTYAQGMSMDQRLTVLDVASESQETGRMVAKRAVDIVLGSAFFFSTLPVMLVAAIAIKLTSHGPALFAQDRVGFNKRTFRMYKFRTMVIDAEREQERLEARNEMDGPVFKIQNDPRITRVGRWLRKTSLDELPQLYNVIRGDMSLVGPRPLPLRDYNGFTKDWQRRRFTVRPGLTCLWQINGRNHTSFEDWMKLDMEYIDNWTFLGDVRILLRTIPAVINGKGAA